MKLNDDVKRRENLFVEYIYYVECQDSYSGAVIVIKEGILPVEMEIIANDIEIFIKSDFDVE